MTTKKSNDVIVAIDGTWLMHRAWHVRPNAVQYLILGWVCQYVLEQKASHTLVAFDTGRSFRHDIIENYKGTRVKSEDGTGAGDVFEVTVDYLQSLGIHCEFSGTNEADDVLNTVGYQWPRYHGKRAVLGTKDKDNLQGITEDGSCVVLKPGTLAQGNKLITAQVLFDQTGFTPKQHLDYQTLIGDKIDNIPAIITPAKAKKMILEFGSLKEYMVNNAAWSSENAVALNRNRKAVKLLTDCFELTPEKYAISRLKKGRSDVKSTFYKQLSETSSKRRLF